LSHYGFVQRHYNASQTNSPKISSRYRVFYPIFTKYKNQQINWMHIHNKINRLRKTFGTLFSAENLKNKFTDKNRINYIVISKRFNATTFYRFSDIFLLFSFHFRTWIVYIFFKTNLHNRLVFTKYRHSIRFQIKYPI